MSHPFPKPLHFDNAGMNRGRRQIRLTRPFRAVTSLGVVTVPEGFTSDGGSIPRAAWSVIGNPMGEFLEAAVIHDFLYSSLNREFYRSEADLIFRELMWNSGVNKLKLALMYSAVRMFGWKFYHGLT